MQTKAEYDSQAATRRFFEYGTLAGCVALTGCMSLGIDRMSPEQIKATNGMLTCVTMATAYGRGIQTTVNADDIKKAASTKTKITMSPDCAVTVETDVATVPVLAPAK